MNGVARELQTVFEVGSLGGLSDGHLLDRFVARREEAVFEVIVRRHGPMVWGVCRRVLRDHHDAEDAFQATFLVLARRAASVLIREKLGHWLYGVAYQTAMKARVMRAKRRAREIQVAELPETIVSPYNLKADLDASLGRELGRLPEKYRIPVFLCELEGKTHREAAEQLGWPIGTVSSRLARARAMLARRLSQRGVPLSMGSLAVLLAEESASASMPTRLIGLTAQAASLFAAGGADTAGVISAEVAALTGEMLNIMLLSKMKIATATILMVSALAVGAAGLAYRAQAMGPTSPEEQQRPGDQEEKPNGRRDQAGQGTAGSPLAGGVVGQSRPEDRPRPRKPPELPGLTGEEHGGVTKENLIAGLLARSTAITSGRFEYHLRVEIAGRVERDSDYRFSFSGEDWAALDLRSRYARVNHGGRLLTYAETPQGGGRLDIDFSESPFKNPPFPPVRAGTLWNSSTGQFVRERASKARLLGDEDVNGVKTLALEWDVDPEEKYLAFRAISGMLKEGGKVRLYAAPQLGHALLRIEHVDRFGTVQDRYDYSEFQEVAPRIHVPKMCRLGVGDYRQEYCLTKIENINTRLLSDDFILSIPAGTSVQDIRRKLKDKVNRDGNWTFNMRDYPFRHFRAEAPYPHGFPPGLLKELDRDVVKPTGR